MNLVETPFAFAGGCGRAGLEALSWASQFYSAVATDVLVDSLGEELRSCSNPTPAVACAGSGSTYDARSRLGLSALLQVDRGKRNSRGHLACVGMCSKQNFVDALPLHCARSASSALHMSLLHTRSTHSAPGYPEAIPWPQQQSCSIDLR